MTAPVYPDDYLQCEGCKAVAGARCYGLSSGGPQALPPVLLDEPHRSRKTSRRRAGEVSAVREGVWS